MSRRVVKAAVPSLHLSHAPVIPRRRPVQPGEEAIVLLVASAGDWLGVARLPRLLRSAGCRVVLFAPPGALAARSRHVDEVIRTAGGGEFFDALRDHVAGHGDRYHWIILATDIDVLGLAARADEPWARELLPLDGASGDPALLTSKQRFTDAMAAAGVPVPMSIAATSVEEALTAADRIGYPVILKPVAGSAGSGIGKASSPAELAAAWPSAARKGVVVVQRFHDGRVGSAQVVFDRGVPRCWMASYKARTWPAPFGPSTARHFLALDGMEGLLGAVGAAIGLDGLVCLDFIHDRSTGAVHFLELNARPSPVMHLHAFARADFPGAIRAMLHELRPAATPRARRGVECDVRLFPQDLIRALTERDYRSIAAWLLPWSWRDVPFGDPGLLAAHLGVTRRSVLGR